MDPAHPLHATANGIFYDHPRVPTATKAFDVPASRDWKGWASVDHGPWRHWGPTGSGLADQGWKVHVSATHASADETLRAVAEHCHDRGTAFKFLGHDGHLEAALAKDADRSRAGKFITIYPGDVAELHQCLLELDRMLAGSPGPYILSDLRWNDGPLYVRYGAFRAEYVWHRGLEVPAIRDLRTGALVPDVRGVAFTVPGWVDVPEFIAQQARALETAPPDGFPTLTTALHHSNAGGVYAGTLATGRRVVVKEARPHTGRTPDGRDAVQRLHSEARALRSLPMEVAAPAVVGELTIHGHHFLVMEEVDGRSLASRVATDNPYGSPDATEAELHAYGAWAKGIGEQLRELISRVHHSGYTHGDLHPGNILVSADNTLSLIDFEMSVPVGTEEVVAFGVPGFVSGSTANPVDRDKWAVACVEMHLLLPLTPLLHLDPTKAGELSRSAAAIFGLSADWVEDMTSRLLAGITAAAGAVAQTMDPPRVSFGVVRDTLVRDATPMRADRLWPGDPRQFEEDPLGLAHGALGVAWALGAAGRAPDPVTRDWIARELDLAPRSRLGLMDGVAGAALACRSLGWDELADRLFEQLLVADLRALPPDLYSGLAGIGLALLSEANQDPRIETVARDILEMLNRHWQAAIAPASVPPRSGGLLGGASGTALLALMFHERGGDSTFLRTAHKALEHDLQSLTRTSDGTLHVNEGWRTLPYLGWGSAGIGLILAQYLSVEDDPKFSRLLDGIISASTAPYTAQAGLFQGRAGLMVFLAEMRRLGRGGERADVALHRHEAALTLHALRDGEGVRFAGDGLLRASCDVATGSAGVLLALSHLRNPYPLRGFPETIFRGASPTDTSEGGEIDGVSALAPGTRAR